MALSQWASCSLGLAKENGALSLFFPPDSHGKAHSLHMEFGVKRKMSWVDSVGVRHGSFIHKDLQDNMMEKVAHSASSFLPC